MKHLQIHSEADDDPPTEGPLQLNLNMLDFNTPDNQLSSSFKSFKNQEEICLHIQRCHLLFLKSVVQRLQTSYLKGESNPGVESLQPGDFMLSGGHARRHIGGTIFYPVVCPKLPARVFAAKVSFSAKGIRENVFCIIDLNYGAVSYTSGTWVSWKGSGRLE